jgi:beta-galactosidase/beta-glucuronidase
MLPSIETWFALWDNHDRPETRTHGLLFSLPVGKGKLIVSTLNHEGATNAAGQWLLAKILQSLLEPDQSRSGAAAERGERNLAQLRSEVDRYSLELHDRRWAFQPDPEQRGKERGWHTTDFEDRQWPQIRADRAWEGEGYESLDGWAWYRLQVELPQELQTATHVYLNFTGVDDHYLAYVEGQVVGSGGDIATKRTAFEDRTSHEITAVVRGKSTIQLAVAVYDWYGAGGIFRPVSLSTTPLGGDTPWLK